MNSILPSTLVWVFNITAYVYLLERASSWVGACGFIPCALFHWRSLAVSPDNVIRGHRSLERRNCYEKCESRENNYCPTPLTFSRVQGKDSTIVMLNKSFPGCKAFNLEPHDYSGIEIEHRTLSSNNTTFFCLFRSCCQKHI